MPNVSPAQIKMAREMDLLTYLRLNEPHELRKTGANEYRTVTHSSLVISNGYWYWNRGGFGAKSALDFLVKVRGMGFADAVQAVLGVSGAALSVLPVEQARPPPRVEFRLPEAAAFPSNVVAYLQKRGISPNVINRCLEAGVLYESRQYRNAVFVGKDEHGKPRFACLRGTSDDFKRDVSGSDKRYSFALPAKGAHSRHLTVFESPIDLLSHATLQERNGWNFDGHRLSLGGVTPIALTSFLERHPQITRVVLHLDNDEAGLTAAHKIKAELAADSRFKHIRASVNPPRGAKDYNELLLKVIERERKAKQRNRQRADILI